MKTFVTTQQVLELAFGDIGYVSPKVVSNHDIAVVQHRYILPVVGEQLYGEIESGKHEDLLNDYIAPSLAWHVRLLIEPMLGVSSGAGGGVVLNPPSTHSAAQLQGQRLKLRSLRIKAKELMAILRDYVSQYEPEGDDDDGLDDTLKPTHPVLPMSDGTTL